MSRKKDISDEDLKKFWDSEEDFGPELGGCYFCGEMDGELVFSEQVESNVHIECVEKLVEEEGEGEPLAMLVAEEFDLLW